jgi:hypothetical protein
MHKPFSRRCSRLSRRLLLTTAGVVLVTATLTAAGTSAAVPASQDFSSSFEAGDPQPTWTDTVDDGKASGVTGPAATGIPGNVTHKVVEVTANGEFADAGEVKENLTDGDLFSKWLVFESTGWVQYRLSEPVKVVLYALGSANDAPERDPQDWTLRASDDGQTWATSTHMKNRGSTRPTGRSATGPCSTAAPASPTATPTSRTGSTCPPKSQAAR